MSDPNPQNEITPGVVWDSFKHDCCRWRRLFFKSKRWRIYRVVYITFHGSLLWFWIGTVANQLWLYHTTRMILGGVVVLIGLYALGYILFGKEESDV